jgi:hypothetical protein
MHRRKANRALLALASLCCLAVAAAPAPAAAETVTLSEVFGPSLTMGTNLKAQPPLVSFAEDAGKVMCSVNAFEGAVAANESVESSVDFDSITTRGDAFGEGLTCPSSTTLGSEVEVEAIGLPWTASLTPGGKSTMVSAGPSGVGFEMITTGPEPYTCEYAIFSAKGTFNENGKPFEYDLSEQLLPLAGGPFYCPASFRFSTHLEVNLAETGEGVEVKTE